MPPSENPPPYSAVSREHTEGINERRDNERLRLVVGIDFGTTYSGVSFVGTEGRQAKVLEDVLCVREWPGPGRQGDYSWKTPSRLAYGHENPSEDGADDDDNDAPDNCYGFEVAPNMKSYSWMKLLLDPLQREKHDDPTLSQFVGNGVLACPPNKKSVDLCADYLTEISRFAYKEMVKKLGQEMVKETPMDFWITVPAVWSDKAKSDTLRAVRKAAQQAKVQIHQDSHCFLISEPEAAAVAVISALTQGNSQSQIKAGDNVLVCDCGGGTVDITTYEIAAVEPKLQFRELQVGTGGKCGSTWIDRHFMNWMEQKFGKAYTDLSLEIRGPTSRFMKDFEGFKRDFGKFNNPAKRYKLPLSLRGVARSKNYDDRNSYVILHNEDLKSMFDPVVAQIFDLLEQQRSNATQQPQSKPIDLVLLVGGFGESVYLNDQLRAWCQGHGMRLICPEHAQSAIVRGAALSGLHEIQPISRRSRRHYGFELAEAFDRRRHKAEDAFYDDWDGRKMASGNMYWKLNKGDIVNDTTSIEFTFISLVRDGRSSTIDVYACDLDEAPDHVRDQGVKKLAEIRVAFDELDLSQEPTKIVNGTVLNQIETDYSINFGHRRGVLEFTCSSKGHKIGDTTVRFDGQSFQDAAEGVGAASGDTHAPHCAMQ
ncbi:Heat shock 70 kDa protein 12B [Pseudocercospora fuligena]|uniref:Heat shock 70 kDa protein 12B n=1 Tax=Pseudocercospora fuligena TaxID=685502 RepID=A0A8H6RB21_9PEZI|nr:Heat shock 70 kDa protein 12B [Pseudocercospora fuligena]